MVPRSAATRRCGLLRRRRRGRGRRPVRLLPGHRAPARGRAARRPPSSSPPPSRARRDHARPPRYATGCWYCAPRTARVTEIAAALSTEGTAGLGADGLGDPARRGHPTTARRASQAAAPRPPTRSRPARLVLAGRDPLPCDHAGLFLLLPRHGRARPADPGRHRRLPGTRVLSAWHSVASLLLLKCSRRGRAATRPPRRRPRPRSAARADRAAQGHPPDQLLLPGPPRRQPALLDRLAPRCREIGLHAARPGSTWTSTPSATTAARSRSRSTTCPPARSGPARCSPSSPKTTPPPRWSTPTPTSPRPNKPAR